MATIAEMVEDEATRAESEAEPGEPEPSEPEPGEPEPEPEPEQVAAAPPFDPKELERELARHEKAMAKVLGDGFADMQPCETCGSAGYVPAGFTAPPEVLADPEAVACPACNGYGLRLTHSLREGNETITCEPCQGKGWQDRRAIEAARAVASYTPPALAPTVPPPPRWNVMTQQYEDESGRPLVPSYAAPEYPA